MKTKTIFIATFFTAISFSGCGSSKTTAGADSEGHCDAGFIASYNNTQTDRVAVSLDSGMAPAEVLTLEKTLDTDCTSFFSSYAQTTCSAVSVSTGETVQVTSDDIGKIRNACAVARVRVANPGEPECEANYVSNYNTMQSDMAAIQGASNESPAAMIAQLRTFDTDCTGFFNQYGPTACLAVSATTGEPIQITASDLGKIQKVCTTNHGNLANIPANPIAIVTQPSTSSFSKSALLEVINTNAGQMGSLKITE